MPLAFYLERYSRNATLSYCANVLMDALLRLSVGGWHLLSNHFSSTSVTRRDNSSSPDGEDERYIVFPRGDAVLSILFILFDAWIAAWVGFRYYVHRYVKEQEENNEEKIAHVPSASHRQASSVSMQIGIDSDARSHLLAKASTDADIEVHRNPGNLELVTRL